MQMPAEIKKLIDAMTDVDQARNTELSVSVYIDGKAPGEVVAHVRGLFASESSRVRMMLSYLDSSFTPHAGDDMAVVVAGSSRTVGAAAAAIRGVGVPTAIVTTLPVTVERLAEAGGHAIPDGDIVAPYVKGWDDWAESNEDFEPNEPVEFTDEVKAAIDERLGQWIVSVCQEKRLAFAIAFPFLRRSIAVEAVKLTSLQNAGIGLVPFFPGADLPIMTLNQAKMVLQIAAAYGQDMNMDRIKELAAVLGGAFLCRTLARELVEFVPVLGFIVRSGVAYGGTAAIGHAAIEYFEGGQDASGVANVATKATSAVSRLVNIVRNNPEAVVSHVRSNVEQSIPIAREKANEYVPIARDLVSEYAPKVREAANEYVPAVKQAVQDTIRSAKADAEAGAKA